MNEETDPDLDNLLRLTATRFRASQSLESAIRTEVALLSASERKPARRSGWRWRSWGYAGLGFACGMVLSVTAVLVVAHKNDVDALLGELTGNHIRALMASHLTDIASSDQHTVKPWFQGKLNYAPPVRDLSAEGFPLVGGRLDYLSERAVAALVYGRRSHMINVYVWPASGTESSVEAVRQGYNVMHWYAGGMQYWAVSDVSSAELRDLSQLLR